MNHMKNAGFKNVYNRAKNLPCLKKSKIYMQLEALFGIYNKLLYQTNSAQNSKVFYIYLYSFMSISIFIFADDTHFKN